MPPCIGCNGAGGWFDCCGRPDCECPEVPLSEDPAGRWVKCECQNAAAEPEDSDPYDTQEEARGER